MRMETVQIRPDDALPCPPKADAGPTRTACHMEKNVAEGASGPAGGQTTGLHRRSLACLHEVKIVSKFHR